MKAELEAKGVGKRREGIGEMGGGDSWLKRNWEDVKTVEGKCFQATSRHRNTVSYHWQTCS